MVLALIVWHRYNIYIYLFTYLLTNGTQKRFNVFISLI